MNKAAILIFGEEIQRLEELPLGEGAKNNMTSLTPEVGPSLAGCRGRRKDGSRFIGLLASTRLSEGADPKAQGAFYRFAVTDLSPFIEPSFSPDTAIVKEFGLSDREAEILRLLALGYAAQDIETKLFISKNTVKTHLKHIYSKTETSSRRELFELLKRKAGHGMEEGSLILSLVSALVNED